MNPPDSLPLPQLPAQLESDEDLALVYGNIVAMIEAVHFRKPWLRRFCCHNKIVTVHGIDGGLYAVQEP